MRQFIIAYWYEGRDNYVNIEAPTLRDAEEKCVDWLQQNCREAYDRGEWSLDEDR